MGSKCGKAVESAVMTYAVALQCGRNSNWHVQWQSFRVCSTDFDIIGTDTKFA